MFHKTEGNGLSKMESQFQPAHVSCKLEPLLVHRLESININARLGIVKLS